MSFKCFALPRPEKVLTVSHPVKMWKPMIDSGNNSSVALQTFSDVTIFSLTAVISVILLECFTPVRKYPSLNVILQEDT